MVTRRTSLLMVTVMLVFMPVAVHLVVFEMPFFDRWSAEGRQRAPGEPTRTGEEYYESFEA